MITKGIRGAITVDYNAEEAITKVKEEKGSSEDEEGQKSPYSM